MAIRADDLTLGDFRAQFRHARVVAHLRNRADLYRSGEVVELQRGGMGVVPAIGATLRELDRADVGDFLRKLRFGPAGSVTLRRVFADLAGVVALVAQCTTGVLPIVTVYTKATEIIEGTYLVCYAHRRSLLTRVGHVAGALVTPAATSLCPNYTIGRG